MADDRDLATAITDAGTAIVVALERSGTETARLAGEIREVRAEVRALGVEFREVRTEVRETAWAATQARLEARKVSDRADALLERTPVTVAATPPRAPRWPLLVVGAFGVLVAVAGLAGALYVACQSATPIGPSSWVERKPKPPCKTPCKTPPPRRPISDLGTDPADRTVDPVNVPAESDKVGCEEQGGLPNWQRTDGCKHPEPEPTPEY